MIIEFSRRDLQTNILKARNYLKNKKEELGKLECPKLSVVESMYHEYKRLDYACRMLVKSNDMEKTFFFNRKLNVVKNGEHQLIAHRPTSMICLARRKSIVYLLGNKTSKSLPHYYPPLPLLRYRPSP